jgi:hypothetical protein
MCELSVYSLEPGGRLEYEGGGIVASIAREGDLTEECVQLCTLQIIQGSALRYGSES